MVATTSDGTVAVTIEHLENSSTHGGNDLDGSISPGILQRLTPRERDVLIEFRDEPNAKRIAKRLGLSEGTVANYLTRIRQHLRVASQTELMRLLLTHRPPPRVMKNS